MRTEEITVSTGSAATVGDITDEAHRFVAGAAGAGASGGSGGPHDGLLHVFVPHATCGLALVETGSGTEQDLLAAVDELLPADDRWRHRHGARGHGRDHVLPAFVPPYATLPVIGGRLQLGTWQSLCLVDTNRDNRTRRVRFSFLPSG